MRAGAMAKSTFVTASSFASSSSVTSINHVPRPCSLRSSDAWEAPFLAYNTASRSIAAHPIFHHPAPSHFPSINFSPFFTPPRPGPLLYLAPPRSRSRTLSRKCIHRAKMKFREPALSGPPTLRFECSGYCRRNAAER